MLMFTLMTTDIQADSTPALDRVTFRVATPEDAAALTDFLQPVYADTYPNEQGIRRDMFENDTFREHLQGYLGEQLLNPSVQLLVAEMDGTMIGTIGLARDPGSEKSAEVWGFYVATR